MNVTKPLGAVGLAAAALFAGQAFAVPVTCPTGTQGGPTCIATSSTDGAGDSLNELFGSGGSQVQGSGLDIYGGQYVPSSYWQIGSTTGSFNIILKEIAGNANVNTFGIYDPTDPANRLQLFTGTDTTGAKGTLVYNGGGQFAYAPFGEAAVSATFGDGATFGYYLGTPDGVFFSDPSLNLGSGDTGSPYGADGMHHVVAYQGGNGTKLDVNGIWGDFLSNEVMLAWEDKPYSSSDLDYNDFIVLVESVYSVPEPATLAMFGLGILLVGGLVTIRRRRDHLPHTMNSTFWS